MLTFDSLDELWLQVTDEVLTEGNTQPSRNGNTKEILGWSGRLSDPRSCFLYNPERKCSPSYAAAEFIWYMSGERRIDRILPYAPQYERFSEDGVAHGAYGDRLAGKSDPGWDLDASPLVYIIRILAKDPDSRQAVLPLHRISDIHHALAGDRKDIPCTLTLNFLIRDGRLNLVVNMRSNDVWLGLPYDVFCFCHLQMMVANRLGIDVGWYQHQAASMHVYEKHWDRCAEAVNSFSYDAEPFNYPPYNPHGWSEILAKMLEMEQWNREGQSCSDHLDRCGAPPQMCRQLCVMAATKFTDRAIKQLTTPTLKSYTQKYFSKEA